MGVAFLVLKNQRFSVFRPVKHGCLTKLSYYCPLSMLLKNPVYYPAKCPGQKGKRKGRICYNDRCTFQKNSL